MLSTMVVTFLALVVTRIFGHSHCTRAAAARAQIDHLAGQITLFRDDTGRYPHSLDELAAPGADGLGPYAKPSGFIDPWRRTLYYRIREDTNDFILFTLGADGELGGSDENADHQATHRTIDPDH